MPRSEKEILAELKKGNLTLNEKQQLERELEEERRRKDRQYQAFLAIVLSYKAKIEKFMQERRLERAGQLVLFPEIIKNDHTDEKFVEEFHKISKQVEKIFNTMDEIDKVFGPDSVEVIQKLKEEAPTVNKAFNEGKLKEDFKLTPREYSVLAMSVFAKDDINSEELAFSKERINQAMELFGKGQSKGLAEILSKGIRYQNEMLKYEKDSEEISRRGQYLTDLLATMELHPEIMSNISLNEQEIIEAKKNMARAFFINRELVATSCLMQAAMEGIELSPETKEEFLKDAALGMLFKNHGNEILKNGNFSAVKLKQGIIPKELMAMINDMGDAKDMKNYSELSSLDVSNILNKKAIELENEKKKNELGKNKIEKEEIKKVEKKEPEKEDLKKEKNNIDPPVLKKEDAPVLNMNNH